jgi:hypothetical protein
VRRQRRTGRLQWFLALLCLGCLILTFRGCSNSSFVSACPPVRRGASGIRVTVVSQFGSLKVVGEQITTPSHAAARFALNRWNWDFGAEADLPEQAENAWVQLSRRNGSVHRAFGLALAAVQAGSGSRPPSTTLPPFVRGTVPSGALWVVGVPYLPIVGLTAVCFRIFDIEIGCGIEDCGIESALHAGTTFALPQTFVRSAAMISRSDAGQHPCRPIERAGTWPYRLRPQRLGWRRGF